MAFKMKGYGGFHGKKKPTLYKSIELEQMASSDSGYGDMEIEDYDKITPERLAISGEGETHEAGGTYPRGGQRDYFDNRKFKEEGWEGNYAQGYNFDPNPDTASSRGGGTFNLTQKALDRIEKMNPKNLSDKDKEGRVIKKGYMDFYMSIRENINIKDLLVPSGLTSTDKNYANIKFVKDLDYESKTS
jgi:hypothetical protein